MNIPWSKPDITQDEVEAIIEVLRSKWLSMGQRVRAFEQSICEYVGCKYAIMVNNGTSALLAAYLVHGIGYGSYVIVPGYTFIATVNTLLVLGAKPIVVDIDLETFNIDPDAILEVIEKFGDKISAIVAVDVGGMPCDYDKIVKICDKYGITLIEDAAEAFGAEYKRRRIGSHGWTTIFSFHAAKQLTTIEGGAVVTNNSNIAEKIRLIRSHGENPARKYWHNVLGLNLRPLDIQAAIGIMQLRKLDGYIRNRNEVAKFYNEELNDYIIPQRIPSYVTRHPYMFYIARLRPEYVKFKEKLLNYMKTRGIDYRIPWPPVHKQPCCKDRIIAYILRNSEVAFEQAISLPIYNSMKIEEAEYAVKTIKEFFNVRIGE